MRRSWSAWVYLSAWASVLVCAISTHGGAAAAAQPQDSQSGSQQSLQEVTIAAKRVEDQRRLGHAVTGFVMSHSAPGTRTNQIGRWQQRVCPQVMGLQAPAREFITREIVNVARSAGAPTGPVGKKCPITVEIAFTANPQALLDRVAQSFRPVLGFYPASQIKQMTTFGRPIQAWYETGTQSTETQLATFPGMEPPALGPVGFADAAAGNGVMPLLPGGQVDSDAAAAGMQPSGVAGSHLGSRVRSEFLHVLIIADSRQLTRYSLQSIADYLAILSLSRMAQLDRCAPLPSITDLLASGCATPAADSLTAADRAYLKALYSANLEQYLNLERGDIHEQMMRQLEGK